MMPGAVKNHQLLWPFARLQITERFRSRIGIQQGSLGIKGQPGVSQFLVAANQQCTIVERPVNHSRRIKGMRPFLPVLQYQDIRLVFDGRD